VGSQFWDLKEKKTLPESFRIEEGGGNVANKSRKKKVSRRDYVKGGRLKKKKSKNQALHLDRRGGNPGNWRKDGESP